MTSWLWYCFPFPLDDPTQNQKSDQRICQNIDILVSSFRSNVKNLRRNVKKLYILTSVCVMIMVAQWTAFAGRSRCGPSSRSRCGLTSRSATSASTSTPGSGPPSSRTWSSSGSRGGGRPLKHRRSSGRPRSSLLSMASASGNPQLTPVWKDYLPY